MDCNNFPGVVTGVYSDSIEYLGLINSGRGSCHPKNCNPEKISPETAIKYVEAYYKSGEMGTNLLSGMKKKDFLEFEKSWRLGMNNYCGKCHKFHFRSECKNTE